MRRFLVLLMVVALVGGVFSTAAVGRPEFPDFISFDPLQGEQSEGVAVDKVGNVYVSFPNLGEIRKFTPDGEESVLITFDDPGALGLAVDAPGNVYVARGAPYKGVYKVDRTGKATLVPGTDEIVSSNALAFDKRGNLYISETWSLDEPLVTYPVGCDVGFGRDFGPGGIWRVPSDGVAELWLRDELLTGLCATGVIPFPIGANGIAYRHGALLVNNTEKAAVVRIPIEVGGGPGTPAVLAVVPDLDPTPPTGPPFLDGMALDVHGNIYVPVINQSRVVRIASDGSTIETLATVSEGLDFPASLAFGTGKGERRSLFVSNYAIGPPGGAGPGLVKIDAGMPGLPLP